MEKIYLRRNQILAQIEAKKTDSKFEIRSQRIKRIYNNILHVGSKSDIFFDNILKFLNRINACEASNHRVSFELPCIISDNVSVWTKDDDSLIKEYALVLNRYMLYLCQRYSDLDSKEILLKNQHLFALCYHYTYYPEKIETY